MYKSNRNRLTCLESALLESQITRLENYMKSLSREEIDLVIEICDGQRAGAFIREYSQAEVETFERHAEWFSQIPDSVHHENTRRIIAGLLADGKISQAEAAERLKELRNSEQNQTTQSP